MAESTFLGAGDKPALLGLGDPSLQSICEKALIEGGFTVHNADDHESFLGRFGQNQYQVVIINENFGGNPDQNLSLKETQKMAMNMRRHAFFILIGTGFETLNHRQAFAQSVHVVLQSADLEKGLDRALKELLPENDGFMKMFQDVQQSVAQGG
jgi:chromosome condensin MukBEF ATPase and DNA-binding subunit MukB